MTARAQYGLQPSHFMESGVEPGTVFGVYRNRTTGTMVEAMRREDRMFVAVCVNHGTNSKPGPHRINAERAVRFPQGWCEGCQKLLGITNTHALPPTVNGQLCEACAEHKTGVVRFGHVDTDEHMNLCGECWKNAKVRDRYYDRFAKYIERRRQEWRGMSRKERRQIMKRIAVTGARKE